MWISTNISNPATNLRDPKRLQYLQNILKKDAKRLHNERMEAYVTSIEQNSRIIEEDLN